MPIGDVMSDEELRARYDALPPIEEVPGSGSNSVPRIPSE